MANRKDKERREIKKTNAAEWVSQQGKGDSSAIRLPEHCEWYKLEVGTHEVDFMPFVTGKGNPWADEDFQHFEREWVKHELPTPTGFKVYCCLGNFKKPCPICQRASRGEFSDELLKTVKAKKRHLWLINAKPGEKPGTRQNPWRVFDSNDWNKGVGFSEVIGDAMKSRKDGYKFSDLKEGLKATLTVKELSFDRGKYKAVTRIDFDKRGYTYEDDLLFEAPCLDEMLIELSYKEMSNLVVMGSTHDDDGEEVDYTEEEAHQTRAAATNAKEEDDGEDVEDEAPASKRVTRPAARRKQEEDELEDIDEGDLDETDEAPSRSAKSSQGKSRTTSSTSRDKWTAEVDEDSSPEDEAEEEVPSPKKKRK